MIDLKPLLSPRSVAVIGASPDVGSLRGRIVRVLNCHDFNGKIYPVSRSHKNIFGEPAFSSILDVPETVELAVLIIPAEYVLRTLEDCNKAGVKAALILSSGFAEDSSSAGNDLQAQLSEFANKSGMIISGPNSEGFVNTKNKLCPTFSPTVDGENIDLTPSWEAKARVAAIAQSGGMGFAFFDRARPKYLPFSYIITTGNEACIESLDYVEYLIEKNEADVFLLFMEDVKTPSKLLRVAKKALVAGKPIILTKIGRSDAGARAAASHTASLAGSYTAYKTVFDEYGIIEGEDIEEMVDIASGFIYFGDRLPEGKRVGIFTASGGGGGWMADSCGVHGLDVPILDAKTRKEIDQYLPSYGTSQNPVDGTAGVVREVGYANISRMIASADNVDTVITIASTRVPHKLVEEENLLAELSKETKKPVMIWSYTLPHDESSRTLAASGLPLFTNVRNCTRTISLMQQYKEKKKNYLNGKIKATADLDGRSNLEEAIRKESLNITEFRSMELLNQYGISVNRGILAKDAGSVVTAAKKLGGPVALKIQSAEIPHKSSVGGVKLNLIGEQEIINGFNAIIKNIATNSPKAKMDGVLVQKMVEPGLEIILGITNKDGFGPILMVGFGGTSVETSGDVAFALCPVTPERCESLLEQLKGNVLLDKNKYDLRALFSLMTNLSNFAMSVQKLISEIDLNPVIMHSAGNGISVVDALMVKFDKSMENRS